MPSSILPFQNSGNATENVDVWSVTYCCHLYRQKFAAVNPSLVTNFFLLIASCTATCIGSSESRANNEWLRVAAMSLYLMAALSFCVDCRLNYLDKVFTGKFFNMLFHRKGAGSPVVFCLIIGMALNILWTVEPQEGTYYWRLGTFLFQAFTSLVMALDASSHVFF